MGVMDSVRSLFGREPTTAEDKPMILATDVSGLPPRKLGFDGVRADASGMTGFVSAAGYGFIGSSVAVPGPSNNVYSTKFGAARKGGRFTLDDPFQLTANIAVILPPDDPTHEWALLDFDSASLAHMSTPDLIMLMVDLSPHASRAAWDWCRLCNPGWEYKAVYAGTGKPHAAGQAALDKFFGMLSDRHTSVDVLINRLFLTAFLRGAMFAELVLDEEGRSAVDLVTPDPTTVRFMRVWDEVYGQQWIVGQFQGGLFVPLDRDTIRYVGIDTMPQNPYGRSPAAPSIFSSLFLLGMLHDLRRVVAQQGWSRLDIVLRLQALRDTLPASVVNNPEQWQAYVNKEIDNVITAYEGLEPDDAFVHSDATEIVGTKGAVTGVNLAGVGPIIEILERMVTTSLKSMPLLMGTGGNNGDSNRQWEVHTAGIRSVQHYLEQMLEHFLSTVLRAQGIPAMVQFRFASLREAERFRTAQAEQLEITNALLKWGAGWISQDTASMSVTGNPADEAEPRVVKLATQINPLSGAPTPPPAGTDKVNANPGGAPDNQDTGDSKDPQAVGGDSTNKSAGRMNDLDWARYIVSEYRAQQQLKSVGEPAASVPTEVTFSYGDQRDLLQRWDQEMPDRAGLLDAEVDGVAV